MPPDRRTERQSALRAALEGEGLDGLLVTHLPNIRYLTGFTGSAALLLLRADTTILITDFRYATQAPSEAGSAAVVEVDQKSVWERLGRVLAADSIETRLSQARSRVLASSTSGRGDRSLANSGTRRSAFHASTSCCS